MEDKFTKIYDKNIWGGGSGTGSKMSTHNKKYISFLEDVLHDKDKKIKTICDIGCGDWQFSQFIDWSNYEYTGIDCVPSVIEKNLKDHKKEGVNFECKVVDTNWSPEGYDLIIIKDVIQHWTDEDIMVYFTKILKNNKYVFCTNGFKFMRDPSKNALECRDINNKYSYHPVSKDKYPLNQFNDHLLSSKNYYAKQCNLYSLII